MNNGKAYRQVALEDEQHYPTCSSADSENTYAKDRSMNQPSVPTHVDVSRCISLVSFRKLLTGSSRKKQLCVSQ